MLNIYAQAFMNATRTGTILVEDVLSVRSEKRRRWFHRRKTRLIDPTKL